MFNRRGRRHHRHDLLADCFADFLDGIEVQGVAHGQVQLAVDALHRHDLILLGYILRNGLSHLDRNIHLGQINKLDAQLHL